MTFFAKIVIGKCDFYVKNAICEENNEYICKKV